MKKRLLLLKGFSFVFLFYLFLQASRCESCVDTINPPKKGLPTCVTWMGDTLLIGLDNGVVFQSSYDRLEKKCGKPTFAFKCKKLSITSLACHGRFVAVGITDVFEDQNGAIEIYEYNQREAVYTRVKRLKNAHKKEITSLIWDDEGEILISGGLDGKIMFWKFVGGKTHHKEVFQGDNNILSSTLIKDKLLVVYSNGEKGFFTCNFKKPKVSTILVPEGFQNLKFAAVVSGHTWKTGYFVLGSSEGVLELCHGHDPFRTIENKVLGNHNGFSIHSFALNGNILASVSFDGVIKLWCLSDYLKE